MMMMILLHPNDNRNQKEIFFCFVCLKSKNKKKLLSIAATAELVNSKRKKLDFFHLLNTMVAVVVRKKMDFSLSTINTHTHTTIIIIIMKNKETGKKKKVNIE